MYIAITNIAPQVQPKKTIEEQNQHGNIQTSLILCKNIHKTYTQIIQHLLTRPLMPLIFP